LLLILCIPTLSLRLGSSDAGSDPASTTTRKAYDLLAQGFGPGFNGPLQVVAQLPRSGDRATAIRLRNAMAAEHGVATVTAAQLNPAGDIAVLTAYPATSPQSAATQALVSRLRDTMVPQMRRATGAQVHIGGPTAVFDDLGHTLTNKLPLFIGVVVLLSALLLMAVFRSVLVPLKAVLMNVLSIGAAFGVVVAVFQWGWLANVIGVDRTGPIESFLPVMLFAIVFGLSMDYEVFLMSRVHEEWVRRRDASGAVVEGVATTGRVITAAATIMVCVFASFVLGDSRVIKLFGVGLASAVFIDAFVIRTVLVPAVMELLGRRAWWLPSWLDRRLPRVAVEPHEAPEPARA
jgi:RND superfamily putative drug exporter